MKKLILISILSTFLLAAGFAQSIDKTMATVKLTKTEAITQKQFKKMVEDYEKRIGRAFTMDERKQLLQKLVDEKLVQQAAVKDGITVSDAEANQGLQQTKLVFEMQLGKKITDEQFKKLIESQETQIGYSWDRMMEEVKNTVLMQKYVHQKQAPQLKDLKKPTNAEIVAYYEENRANFISPEMIKVKQILVVTQGLSADIAEKYKKKIDEIYDKIVNKGASFDDYFEVYIEGQKDKIGGLDIGVWQRDDEKKKALYGKDFFADIFKIKAGGISNVVKSNIGYHFYQILEKIPFQTLGLDDKIPPQNTQTVREKISTALEQNIIMEMSQKLLEELVVELKKTL